jgi:hypothetical protein
MVNQPMVRVGQKKGGYAFFKLLFDGQRGRAMG